MNYAKKEMVYDDVKNLIFHYACKLSATNHNKFEDAVSALTLFLFELYENGKCISKNYVATALKNQYIKVSKSIQVVEYGEYELDEHRRYKPYEISDYEIIDTNTDIKSAYQFLTNEQKQVISLYFFIGYSIEEIAKIKGVSRQSVNQTKNSALKKMKLVLQ